MRESGGDVKCTLDRVYRDHIVMYLGSLLLIFIRFTSLCQFSTMGLFQFFIITIFLLSTTSAKTYSVPYQSIQLAFSITPNLLYTSESNPAFSGYSYTTQDFNGGESNVVFTTGADSMDRLKNEMDSIKMSEEYSQRGKNQENMSSEQQLKSEKAEENNKKQDVDSNIKVLNEEKKLSKNSEANNNFIEHQTNSQQISHMNIPYLAFRENLLNLDLPIFPRYQISSNEIQSQYYTHNPYAHLELPVHNFGFYNPIPLFYQATIIPDINSKPATTAVENIKASVEPHITKSIQTNTTNSESTSVKSSIESKFNLESTTNGIEETSSSLPAISMNKLESTTTSEKKIKEKVTSEPAITSQSSVERITDNEANSTETSPLTEKSNMATM